MPTTETAMPHTLGELNTIQLAEKEACGLQSFFTITILASSYFLADMPHTHSRTQLIFTLLIDKYDFFPFKKKKTTQRVFMKSEVVHQKVSPFVKSWL